MGIWFFCHWWEDCLWTYEEMQTTKRENCIKKQIKYIASVFLLLSSIICDLRWKHAIDPCTWKQRFKISLCKLLHLQISLQRGYIESKSTGNHWSTSVVTQLLLQCAERGSQHRLKQLLDASLLQGCSLRFPISPITRQ